MPLTLDQYSTLNPQPFLCQAFAQLSGQDVFFYISDTHELRVKFASNPSSKVLALGAGWVAAIPAGDVVHLYYTDINDTIQYGLFGNSNFVSGMTFASIGIGNVLNFSAAFAPNSVPPAYTIMVDDGKSHNLFVASDPAFAHSLGSTQTYHNSLDRDFFVTHPIISIHPEDTTHATVHCQRIKQSDQTTQVGWYVIVLPGVS